MVAWWLFKVLGVARRSRSLPNTDVYFFFTKHNTQKILPVYVRLSIINLCAHSPGPKPMCIMYQNEKNYRSQTSKNVGADTLNEPALCPAVGCVGLRWCTCVFMVHPLGLFYPKSDLRMCTRAVWCTVGPLVVVVVVEVVHGVNINK